MTLRKKKMAPKQARRLAEAEKTLEQMQKTIQPFFQRQHFGTQNTRGRWSNQWGLLEGE